MDERDDLIKEFLIESYENLDRLDGDLVALEKAPGNRERLASIFRTIHTIKGTCGFLGFTRLEAVTHVGESLLSRLRDSELSLTAEITTALLKLVDAVRTELASIEQAGVEGQADHGPLIALLTALNKPRPAEAAVTAPPAASEVSAGVDSPGAEAAPDVAEGPGAAPDEERRSDDDRRTGDERRQSVSDSSLRVDVGLLDRLMNLVGELVLARNQILQFTATQTNSSFIGASGRLDLVTSELQESVMKTRMQPIGNIWSKFPRVVRDLAAICGKQARLEMEGKETDLDKTIIEAIKDPLTHVVRNSVDHGIESPDERLALGKPAEGRISLRAFHEGGQINIEITDDGAGIDHERVKAKALQRGLISADQARSMSEPDLIRLIFAPGFSTAEKVTNVSGRGVGMDVVKTNIERIGGHVDIHSEVGQGTTLKIKIPLTLAIIPALIVATDGVRYAIPQVSLLELVRLQGQQALNDIERIGQVQFYRLRGNLLPLVYLREEFGLEARRGEVTNIVVLKAGDRQLGLVVEEIHDTEEIVVKPLGKQLKGLKMFAGATIMGDGKVALILDVMGIAQRLSAARDAGDVAGRAQERSDADVSAESQSLLVFQVGESERMAIPLSLVARLEEFPPEAVERSGGRDVVQYRHVIMPLVSLSDFFGVRDTTNDGVRQVIVFTEGRRNVGLVVDRILDIVTEPVALQSLATRTGIRGSIVLQQKVTDLVDVPTIIQATDGIDRFDTHAA